MRIGLGVIIGGSLLMGCGYNTDKYFEDFCDKTAKLIEGDCAMMATMLENEACDQPIDEDACTFDADVAKACIEDEWVCDAEIGLLTIPSSCSRVCAED